MYVCTLYMYYYVPLESLYLLKKPHQNPLDSFEDLSIHLDRSVKGLCFTILLL
jgi:hypothetical protein